MTRSWTSEQEELLRLGADGLPVLKRVAVAADAGAGKTSVLVERVKRLGETKRILCVSFTEKSKADLEQKLADWVSAEVYTIHGFCSRVVSEFGGQLGLPPFFRILDAEERDELFYGAFEKVYRRRPPANLEHGVDRFWTVCRAYSEGESYRVREPGSPVGADTQEFVAEVLAELEASKKLLRALEYSDLERWAVKLLRRPEVSQALRSRYAHLFVDEFQDTSELQCELVHRLAGREGPVFVVGDSKQSIYRFRGADVNVFNAFLKTLPDNRRLSWNFRSHRAVVDAVNEVCAPIIARYDPMTAARPEARAELDPGVFETLARAARVTSASDADGIEALVRRLRSQGVDWSQIVLLVRRVKGMTEFFEELAGRGIAVAVTSASSASSNEDLQKLLNLWIWACEPWQKLRAAQVATDFFEGARAELDHKLATLRSPLEEPSGVVWSCGQLLAELGSRFQLAERFGAVYEQFELFILRRQSEGDLPGTLARRLQHLLSNGQDISGFVLLPPPANLAGTIRVLTVHSAKGLEFPVVILADVKDRRKRATGVLRHGTEVWLPGRDEKGGLDWSDPELQNAKTLEEEAEEDESARLLYVAMTRAQEALYVVDRPETTVEGAETKARSAKNADTTWAAWLKAGLTKVLRAEELLEGTPALLSALGTGERSQITSRFLEAEPPHYSQARIGVTELGAKLAAADGAEARSGGEELLRRSSGFKAGPRLSPEEARDLGIEIHGYLENENWSALKDRASRCKLDLSAFWQWLETAEGRSVFKDYARVFPEFAFEWLSEHGTVTGRMDRLVLVNEEEAWVVDYKILLHPREAADVLATYSNQLRIYGDAVKTLTRLPRVRTFLLDVAASTGAVWHEVLASRP